MATLLEAAKEIFDSNLSGKKAQAEQKGLKTSETAVNPEDHETPGDPAEAGKTGVKGKATPPGATPLS